MQDLAVWEPGGHFTEEQAGKLHFKVWAGLYANIKKKKDLPSQESVKKSMECQRGAVLREQEVFCGAEAQRGRDVANETVKTGGWQPKEKQHINRMRTEFYPREGQCGALKICKRVLQDPLCL